MTASPGREVDANLLRGAAPGSAQTPAQPQDAGGQDLGDLVEALGGGHQVGVEGVGHVRVGVVADRRWRDVAPGETSEPFHAPIQRAVVAGFNGITHRAGEG
jgi:hypothetical protein